MKAGSKLLIGIVLVASGIWLLLPRGGNYWIEALTVITGTFPIILILIGVLIIWIEKEEMKGPPKLKKKR